MMHLSENNEFWKWEIFIMPQNLHLLKKNNCCPELVPYEMMIPGAKNGHPVGVWQTEKPYVKLWRLVLL